MIPVRGEVPRASVIIVAFNSSRVLLSCLASLGDLQTAGVETIVVDNASSDNTVSLITKKYPKVQIIANASNVGFARAVNIGVSASRGRFIVLLNPDATLGLGVLTSLVDEAARTNGIGVIAPLLGDPTGRLRIASAGRDPSAWRMFCHYFGLSRALGRFSMFEGHYLLPRQLSTSREVDWVTGACMVLPKSVWEAVGGMSERWFMYAEDMEFCYRVRKSGYLVVVDPELRATHSVGESTSGNELSSNPAWVINLYDFYASDIATSRFARVMWRLVVSGGLIIRSCAYGFRSISNRTDRGLWAWESKRFAHFAAGALRAPKMSALLRNGKRGSPNLPGQRGGSR
jgi:N-acetylglucosaminyl-diphospho-decaprenol L-rhamnosyltransferase